MSEAASNNSVDLGFSPLSVESALALLDATRDLESLKSAIVEKTVTLCVRRGLHEAVLREVRQSKSERCEEGFAALSERLKSRSLLNDDLAHHLAPVIDELLGLRSDLAEIFATVKAAENKSMS